MNKQLTILNLKGVIIFQTAAICISVFLSALDASITNTALPAIDDDLCIKDSRIIWVVTSYQMIMTAAIIPLSIYGDKFGQRSIFLNSILIFIIGSLLCGYSYNFYYLIIYRGLQGLGAAGIMGANTALIKEIYQSKRLGLGLGINALVIALGLAGGPVVSSFILTYLKWHWIFLINVPLGIIGFLLSFLFIPRNHGTKRDINILQILLYFCSLSIFIILLKELGEQDIYINIILITTFIMLMIIFYNNEINSRHQIINIALMKRKSFMLQISATIIAYAAQGLAMVLLPFFFINNMGKPQIDIGILIAPWPIMGAIMAPLSGAMSDKISPDILGIIGLFILSIALFLLSFHNMSSQTLEITLNMALCGFGFGLFLSPNQHKIMASVNISISGMASGLLGTARLLGQSIGSAVFSFFLISDIITGTIDALRVSSLFSILACFLCYLSMKYSS